MEINSRLPKQFNVHLYYKIKVMTTTNKTSPCVSDIHLYTKMKQDGNLYQSISDMVGTLRKSGFEDVDIKEFILKFTTRIIDEQ